MAKPDGPDVQVLVTCASIGGAERAVQCLAREFHERGVRTQVVFPSGVETTGDVLEWFAAESVNAISSSAVLDLAADHRVRDVRALAAFVRATDAPVVNIHFGGEHASVKDLVALRLAGRRRVILTLHHAVPIPDRRTQVLTRSACLLAHDVVVHTPAMRDLLVGYGVKAGKIHVVPLGLETPTVTPSRVEARSRLELPEDAFIVSCLARLVKHKGIGDLIEAFGEVRASVPGAVLVIAGDGELRDELRAQAAAALPVEAVRFLGRVADVHDTYACADIFALPSYEEGFGLVFIEAAFHGTPAVAADVGGVGAAVLHDRTGLLIDAGDVSGLAGALVDLAGDRERLEAMGVAARDRAWTTFTAAHMADGYLNLLSDTVGA